MKERISAKEAAEEITMATAKAAAEITAATTEFTVAATEIAAVTAGLSAAAAEDMAAFYIDCTKRVIKLCDAKRKEIQSNLAHAIDMADKST